MPGVILYTVYFSPKHDHCHQPVHMIIQYDLLFDEHVDPNSQKTFETLLTVKSFERPETSCSAPVFVEKGKDVFLNVTEADVTKDDTMVWKFNKTVVLVTFFPKSVVVSPDYTGRIEIYENKHSIKLKNLQDADNGVYTARVTGAEKEQHNPVSPVQLTVDSVSNSSDSCNLTVTCSTSDYHISGSFRCDAQTCSQEGGERSEVTTFGAFLHFYLENDSIICEHSNKVSRTKNLTDIRHFCPRHADANKEDNNIAVPLVVCFVIFISLAAAVLYLCRRKSASGSELKKSNDASGLSPVSTAM
ncbi:hypothetical protein L3Q82_006095 [Scortum barcoo]|uniref:Uncharacterized protein n=1 Tax=Scortum barcoo TaxID=214431 RepID=A0ACB8X2Y8_9TELE|nr:hypothetical protein L3Q82_006095 [Scortum barcoo]